MSDPAVVFENVSLVYPGGAVAIENVSLRVEPGELLAIVGPNGGGKSTLLKIMLGLLDDYRGRVLIHGVTPREAQQRGLVGYVPQRTEAELSFPISGRQAVTMAASRGLSPWVRTPPAIRERVARCLSLVGAADYADNPVGAMSGGQLQRILIARALALEPKVLALDEPLTGLDAGGQQQFKALIDRLHRELGLTILLVSHDLRTVAGGASRCDRVACLRRTLHFHDSPRGVTPQVLAEVFQHDLTEVFGEVHVAAHKAADCPGDHPAGHHHHHGPSAASEGQRP